MFSAITFLSFGKYLLVVGTNYPSNTDCARMFLYSVASHLSRVAHGSSMKKSLSLGIHFSIATITLNMGALEIIE